MARKSVVGLVSLFLVLSSALFATTIGYRDGYLLVKFVRTGTDSASIAARQAVVNAAGGGTIKKMYTIVPGLGLVQLPAGTNVLTARTAFGFTPGVTYAEPDYINHVMSIPNDPRFGELWGMNNTGQNGGKVDADIDAPEAWNIATGSSSTVVAVIDTGVDYTHPDLAANMWKNTAELNGQSGVDDDGNGYIDDIYGYDFCNNDGAPMDDSGHGTHCSGTIGAAANNGRGVAGVCWNVRIMALKFLSSDGGGATSDAISCIQYAVQMNARLTSNSWGGGGYSQALYDAIAAAGNAGQLFIAAAGNYSTDNDTYPFYPASYNLANIISVMATDRYDNKADFSHWGKTSVDLGAPGKDILSTIPGNQYDVYSGTSMACPHVSGAAALVWSVNSGLSYAEVKQTLMSTVDTLPALANLCVSNGRLNLHNAVLLAQGPDSLPPLPDPAAWLIRPAATGLHQIVMQAVQATDKSGVQYRFDCIENDAYDSGWQDSALYNKSTYTAGATYSFRVQARDKSDKKNETQWSQTVSTTTTTGVDNLPPAPNPTVWKAVPRVVGSTTLNRVGMEVVTSYDENNVEYFFDCVFASDGADPNIYDSGWQTSPAYTVHVSQVVDQEYIFRAYARQQGQTDPAYITEAAPSMKVGSATRSIVRDVPSPAYATIQNAIDSSRNGDVVVLKQGLYREININFGGKAITVRSQNPENPAVVAATVIDCEDIWDYTSNVHETRRAFLFRNGEGRDSVLAGITIRNATAVDDSQVRLGYSIAHGDPDRGDRYPNETFLDGQDALGGAVYCDGSPTIHNCVFENCSANGQYGRHGSSGIAPLDDTPGHHADRGGDGGNAYGGAVYVVAGSAPLLEGCRFVSCQAVGGDGGDGGNGGNGGGHSSGVTNANGYRGGDGGDAGFAGCAWGGAIYFEPGCSPELHDVTVESCFIKVGSAGHAGNGGNGSGAKGVGYGGHGGNGGVGGDLRAPNSYGGAVYFGDNTNVVIEGCEFKNCKVIAELSGDCSGGNGGNGGDYGGDVASGTVGGDGGQGGPAYFIPDKIRDMGGVTAIGGNGGNGGGAGARQGLPGNGGFRLGLPGTGRAGIIGANWSLLTQQLGIWPSNMYYMSYYWEDTANIDNPTTDPNDYLQDAYDWDWLNFTDIANNIVITTEPNFVGPDPNALVGVPGAADSSAPVTVIFNSRFSPFYGFLDITAQFTGIVVSANPDHPTDPNFYTYDYSGMTFAGPGTYEVRSLTPDTAVWPDSGACAGANYYGRNSVVTATDTVVSGNSSFANHGGGELYDKGCRATFENCIFQDNTTAYDMPYVEEDPANPSARNVDTDYKFEGVGGGIFADQPESMIFRGCLFDENQAYSGGGLYCNFAPSAPNYLPNLELTDSTFTGNRADYHFMYSYGGALYAGNSFDPYEEYYFNDFTSSNRQDFMTSAYIDHGYITFYHAIQTNLWQDMLEADRILWGIAPPHYSVPITNCAFEENTAPYGAGLCMDASVVNVAESQFRLNTALNGAGGYLFACDLMAANNTFAYNTSREVPSQGYQSQQDSDTIKVAGSSAALAVTDSDAFLINDKFIANDVNDISGYAGALYINGLSLTGYPQSVINSLFLGNRARYAGGAIVADSGTDVQVVNSTFVNNETFGYGGAVLVLGDSYMNVANTILWDNGKSAMWGPQICVGDPFDPYHYTTVELDYSDIQGGSDDAYVDQSGWPWLIYGGHNLEADPQFIVISPGDVTGWRFYLAETMAGQLSTSPCVDAGSPSCSLYDPDAGDFIYVPDVAGWLGGKLGFDITTRTDHIADSGVINMGYHYDNSLPPDYYELNIKVVIPDLYPHGSLKATCLGNSVGIIASNDPNHAVIMQGMVVTLTALPEAHYRVKRWTGTDDDNSYEEINYAMMSGSRNVEVWFEPNVPQNRLVPSDYPTIEEAFTVARSGDTIILAPRPLMPYIISNTEGIDFSGRNIVLRSENPDDPYVVANTIIDCQGTRYEPQRAFIFRSGEGPNTVIEGITIRNAFKAVVGASAALDTGRWPWPFDSDPDPLPPFRALSGADATGDSYGGAILCANGSSPVIRKCVFENCTVSGGIGGDGADGYPSASSNWTTTADIDSQSGGHSGKGSGNGYGGAIAVIGGSSPVIENCTFRNNRATGGWGGIPGNAGKSYNNGRYGWGGNDPAGIGWATSYGVNPQAGYGEGDGRGGAIYIEGGCQAKLINNHFEGNYARLGFVYAGGQEYGGSAYPDPWDEDPWGKQGARVGRDGQLYGYGTIAGGAVTYSQDAAVYIRDCVFDGNKAYESADVTDDSVSYDNTRGGAVAIDPESTVSIVDCSFIDSRPGAINAGEKCRLSINKCLFDGNGDYDRDYQADYAQVTLALYEHYYSDWMEIGGGGLYIAPNCPAVDVNDCNFSGNYTLTYGGAINSKSDIVLTNCTLSGNEALANGGAIDLYYYIYGEGVHTLTMNLVNCTFGNNRAGALGGAIHSQNFEATLNQCYFVGNTAWSGGAMCLSEGQLNLGKFRLANSLFSGNTATGMVEYHQTSTAEGTGGAIACRNTSVEITDTVFAGNRAQGGLGRGGAIEFTGGNPVLISHIVDNCLFTGNYAKTTGGAVSMFTDVLPSLRNCTFAANTTDGSGGGLYIDRYSSAALINSIFTGNNGYAIYEQLAQTGAAVRYCMFNDNPDGTYNAAAGKTANMLADPKFVVGDLGNYYLDQTGPAIDTGLGSAEDVFDVAGLGWIYTTSTADDNDADAVDLGYHYFKTSVFNGKTFTLTTSVEGSHGTVSPPPGVYYPGQMVNLTVSNVDTDYIIAGWSGGTIDDSSTAATNSVIMTSNKNITVLMRQRRMLEVGSSSQYSRLQDAIDDAQDGDTIHILPGKYNSDIDDPVNDNRLLWEARIDMQGKSLHIVGKPSAPLSTEFSYFRFEVINTGPDTSIEGICIRRSQMDIVGGAPTIRNCVFRECQWWGNVAPKTLKCSSSVVDGRDGYEVFGGAIYVAESEPKFIGCVFDDNSANGGAGQTGADGCTEHPTGGDGGWGGKAYGGAVYAAFSSRPVFENCLFTGNQVRGGAAGDGGEGALISGVQYHGGRGGSWLMSDSQENEFFGWWDGWEEGDRYWTYYSFFGKYDWETWVKWFGWDKWNTWEEFYASPEANMSNRYDKYDDYWKYSGFGGAVYCAYDTQAKFTNCRFENNQSHGGMCGAGGLGSLHSRTPDRQLNLPNAGGAVYAAYDSSLEFTGCTFSGNTADRSTVDTPYTYNISFGGAVAYDFDCSVRFTNCDIGGNEASIGGGVYGRYSDTVVADCNVADNFAYVGAGGYLEYDNADIERTYFKTNHAGAPEVIVTPPDEQDDDLVIPTILDDTGDGGGLCVADPGELYMRDSVFYNNQADISGGGIYLTGNNVGDSRVFNCLMIQNSVGGDGGGASVNWYATPKFANCTFANNSANGYQGDYGNIPGSGGGLYCGYYSDVQVIDSIFRGNTATQGSQITVGAGFDFDPWPSRLNISYSDVQNLASTNAVYVGPGCTLTQGSGMLDADPLFEGPAVGAMPWQQYYLGDASPCIDKGHTTAFSIGLLDYTTRLSSSRDEGMVDLGYHYNGVMKTTCGMADIVLSGQVDMADLIQFAIHWMDSCSQADNWCGRADLNFDTNVNNYDFNVMAGCWLAGDTEPPLPNPVQWLVPPYAVSGAFDTITMTALDAHDAWWPDSSIQYQFECTNDATKSSPWQNGRTWSLSSFSPGLGYGFAVRAKDGSGNITQDPNVVSAVAGGNTKPSPNPAQWQVPPYTSTTNTVAMEAVPYNGPTLPTGVTVQYWFKCLQNNVNGGNSSSWQTSTVYTDSGLTVGLTYQYQVQMRFLANGSFFGEGGLSPIAEVTVAEVVIDTTPPLPNPSTWAVRPTTRYLNSKWYHQMVATAATDTSGVEYQFERVSGPAIPGTWWNTVNSAGITDPDGSAHSPNELWVEVGSQFLDYSYRVRTRDQSPLQNTGNWSITVVADQ